MTTHQTTPSRSDRVIHTVSAAAHLVIAVALSAIAVAQASILLPVALSTPAVGAIGTLGFVDFAAAAAVVLLISTAAHAASALSREASPLRARLLHLVAFAQTSAITVFIVAQLNGVAEAGALILVYAMAGAAAGLLWLQAREVDDRARARWPFSFSAPLAVVPWGIVALYQIAALAVGSPPAPLVRVFTVVILVIVCLSWWVERLVQLGTLAQQRSVIVHAALSLANGVALLMLAVGLARPSALL